jgi:uncharacterized protein (DUF302 family)
MAFYVVETAKSFEEACSDLKAAAASHGFGVLAIHDLAATLQSKHINFPESCRVFEVCNPQQAAKVLQCDMSMSMALPCRISVYTEDEKTWIGMIRPVDMLADLSASLELADVAKDVDSSLTALMTQAASCAPVCSTC